MFEEERLPELHLNLLWIAVPDVVGDADATLERFREWHMWLCHLGRLAYVLQDGAERPGRVPWDAPGLAAVFVSSAAARAGSWGPMPPGLCAKRGRGAC